jgi:hypothetical protein
MQLRNVARHPKAQAETGRAVVAALSAFEKALYGI